MDKIKKNEIVRFAFFILFLIGLIAFSIFYFVKMKNQINFENIRDLILKKPAISALIFVLLQIVQVVVFVIPGDLINAVGGFVFNGFYGFLLSFIGVVIGSILSFYISRLLGYSFISKIIKKEKLDRIIRIMDSEKGFLGLFIITNLPFVPKDILMYGAGLTPLKAKKTITMYCLCRIPGILIWNLVGANVYNKSILGLVITIIGLITFLLGLYILKNKYSKKISQKS